MKYTKCSGKPLAIEYNKNYVNNIKLACYCPFCILTTKQETTPYKIIQTDNGYTKIFDKSYYEKKDKKCEEIPSSNNPHDPFSSHHRSPNEICFYNTTTDEETDTDTEM
jgi:hypothetical protein